MPVWKLAGWHWSLLERRFRLRCNYVGASSTSRSPRLLLPSPWKRRIGAKLTMNVPVSRNARPEQCNSIYLLAAALRCNVYACMRERMERRGKIGEQWRVMRGCETAGSMWNFFYLFLFRPRFSKFFDRSKLRSRIALIIAYEWK